MPPPGPSRRQRRQERFEQALAKLAAMPEPLITHLTPGAKATDRVSVRVSTLRVAQIAHRDVRRLGLHVGQAWTGELADRVRAAGDRLNCRTDALRLLERRAYTRAGLARKLQLKQHPRALADDVADEMVRLALIDDARYAHDLAASTLRTRPVGKGLIERTLIRKGVPRELARAVASETTQGRDALTDATALARKRAARLPATLDRPGAVRRLMGVLARRGFDPNTARRAIDTALKARRPADR